MTFFVLRPNHRRSGKLNCIGQRTAPDVSLNFDNRNNLLSYDATFSSIGNAYTCTVVRFDTAAASIFCLARKSRPRLTFFFLFIKNEDAVAFDLSGTQSGTVRCEPFRFCSQWLLSLAEDIILRLTADA